MSSEREKQAGTPAEEPPAPLAEEPIGPILTHPTAAYRFTRFTTGLWLRVVHRLRVEGLEHLPREGGVMLATNHQSFLDIPLIARAVPRHVSFVARDTLAAFRPLAWLMRQCGAVLVRREGGDRRAMREIVEHLRQGDCVSIFPEGTRTADGTLGPFRRGAVLGARQARVPIVPAAIRGTFEALPRQRRLPIPRPHPVSIRFGAPIDPRGGQALEEVRAAVERLLAGGLDRAG